MSSSSSGSTNLQVTDEAAPLRLVRLERKPSFGRLETIEEEIMMSCEASRRRQNNQLSGFGSSSCKPAINPKQR